MGCAASRPEDAVNSKIENELKEDRKKLNREVKLLLLGTGESGKTTITKQLKILNSTEGVPEAELIAYKPVITNCVLTAYKNIITATETFGQLGRLNTPELREAANFFKNVEPLKDELHPAVAIYIRNLVASPVIQDTLTQYSQFQLPDNTTYLTTHIERICAPGYLPTQEDYLQFRSRTTGIMELEFNFDNHKFRIVDVGGQRSERKKWIHIFEGVTGIIFCVALSEYDQKLFEDEKVNRMHEAIELFEEICNSEWFVATDIILFFNKDDLFRNKVTRVDLSTCFPEYTGGKEYEPALAFIKDRFMSLNKNPQKQIYAKVTTATNTKNIETVFAATKNIILQKQLSVAGF